MKKFLKRESVSEDIEDTDPCAGLSFRVGVSESKNGKYRRSMEDVHTYVANFCERLDWGYFAVFDGHAGKVAARWCGRHLHGVVAEEVLSGGDVQVGLDRAFQRADAAIAAEEDVGRSGCTAAVAVLRWEEVEGGNGGRKRVLYTANAGDTRVVLGRSGGGSVRLSYEHKGSDLREVRRIEQSGGVVLGERVNGVLAVTRALGDIYAKEHVIGRPFTTQVELQKDDTALVIACDGLWDVCSDEVAVEMVNREEDPQKASAQLVEYALREGTTDNVTVMVVKLESRDCQVT